MERDCSFLPFDYVSMHVFFLALAVKYCIGSVPAHHAPPVFLSAHGGQIWRPFSTGLPEDAAINGFLDANGDIYAATEQHGVFINRNHENWVNIGRNLPQGIDVNAIARFGDFVVIGTSRHGVYTLPVGGNDEWKHEPGLLDKIPVRGLYSFQERLFAGTDEGVFRSDNAGKKWEQVLSGAQINGFASGGGKIYAAAHNGALMSNDGGATWRYIYRPFALHDIASDGTRVFAMTLGDGLLASVNDGLSWESVNLGLGERYTFEVVRSGDNLFAAQWTTIFQSGNSGKYWTPASLGLPDATAFTALAVTRHGLVAGVGLR